MKTGDREKSILKFGASLTSETPMIRTKRQAYKEAVRRWGDSAAVQWNSKALTDAEKKLMLGELNQLRANLDAARSLWLSERTPERKAAHDAAKKAFTALRDPMLMVRAQVGRIESPCGITWFAVQGSGDTWDEAFKKVDDRAAKEHAEFVARRKELLRRNTLGERSVNAD